MDWGRVLLVPGAGQEDDTRWGVLTCSELSCTASRSVPSRLRIERGLFHFVELPSLSRAAAAHSRPSMRTAAVSGRSGPAQTTAKSRLSTRMHLNIRPSQQELHNKHKPGKNKVATMEDDLRRKIAKQMALETADLNTVKKFF